MDRCFPRHEGTPGGHAGFTLVELIVSIAITALVTTVARPAMLDVSFSPDAGPLEDVCRVLLDARHESTNRGVRVEGVLIPFSGRYVVDFGAGSERHEGRVVVEASHVRDADERVRVVFDPVGIAVGDTLAAADSLLPGAPVGASYLLGGAGEELTQFLAKLPDDPPTSPEPPCMKTRRRGQGRPEAMPSARRGRW